MRSEAGRMGSLAQLSCRMRVSRPSWPQAKTGRHQSLSQEGGDLQQESYDHLSKSGAKSLGNARSRAKTLGAGRWLRRGTPTSVCCNHCYEQTPGGKSSVCSISLWTSIELPWWESMSPANIHWWSRGLVRPKLNQLLQTAAICLFVAQDDWCKSQTPVLNGLLKSGFPSRCSGQIETCSVVEGLSQPPRKLCSVLLHALFMKRKPWSKARSQLRMVREPLPK